MKQLKIFLIVLSIYTLHFTWFLSLFGGTCLFILLVRYSIHFIFLIRFFQILLLYETTFTIFFRLNVSLILLILILIISRTTKSRWNYIILSTFDLRLRVCIGSIALQILIYPVINVLHFLLNKFLPIIVCLHFNYYYILRFDLQLFNLIVL